MGNTWSEGGSYNIISIEIVYVQDPIGVKLKKVRIRLSEKVLNVSLLNRQ